MGTFYFKIIYIQMTNPPKYYLVHSIVPPSSDKVLKILRDGYLYASSYSGFQGISGIPLDYVYFTLLGDSEAAMGGFKLILDSKILYKRSFRYALSWVGSSIESTIKVNPRKDDVNAVLDEINDYIIKTKQDETCLLPGLHEIIIKKKVDLHKYLRAICYRDKLSEQVINFIQDNYPGVMILNDFPKSASELNKIIDNTLIKY
ncbi:hypothetical protein ma892 [Moumouvirus australiensis]|uniref:Uncharacterized protein n=1 Tax=Moumouvirus australiensis TaxID=2109587 RepID=A0A2P1EN23_9VIRU|nr:hypothetical protein QKC55_gp880 [Moumouvirus australiensis]YP_010790212.1 hypothetical protein QKC55_gp012 [Moumouvirus australiensis]AVL94410.1 hypothetical protein ma23 [Moumouvirus australiensis]AVL95279.1 hypothetical protein ma892 [Moumouvirus australiensis]